eukprot:TRINITY_DN5224_c0_g1_i2.p1 TRINITY_DN5224_c0_g1~~TRINITY_DN5224_c0_g1_i2.p1  ORF type:complete len:265 (+),score=57.34 TRINITY_DN5224_c0_g1_i2:39-797(+)
MSKYHELDNLEEGDTSTPSDMTVPLTTTINTTTTPDVIINNNIQPPPQPVTNLTPVDLTKNVLINRTRWNIIVACIFLFIVAFLFTFIMIAVGGGDSDLNANTNITIPTFPPLPSFTPFPTPGPPAPLVCKIGYTKYEYPHSNVPPYCAPKFPAPDGVTYSMVNTTSDPCHSFYDHACGAWRNQFPRGNPRDHSFSNLFALNSRVVKEIVSTEAAKTWERSKLSQFTRSCFYALDRYVDAIPQQIHPIQSRF